MSNDIVKLRIDRFYKSEEQQYIFLRRLALTYRAKLPLLSELFQIPEDELYEKLMLYNSNVEESLKYLFNCDTTKEEESRINIISFYNKLLKAVITKDKNMQTYLIGKIADSRIKRLIKEKHIDRRLSEEEIIMILKYQLKYALDSSDVAGMFGINAENYRKRIVDVIKKDEHLKEQYDILANYQRYLFYNAKKPKRG